jgi:hypothetical protein
MPRKIFVGALLLAFVGTSWWLVQKQVHVSKQQQISAAIAEQRQRQADEAAQRKAAHASLMAMTNDDFTVAGQRCVTKIENEKEADNNLGWEFVEIDPQEFSGIKTSTLMGLQFTAAGAQGSVEHLIEAQVGQARRMLAEYSKRAQMQFVIAERIDSFGGVKEALSLYKCEFSSADDTRAYEVDKFLLN